MPIWIHFEFMWVPSEFGGNKGTPYPNMRTEIGWQRHLGELQEFTIDIQWVQFDYDETTRQGYAKCSFGSHHQLPEERLKPDQFIIILNGPRILAIGRIVEERSL
ncbi:hypothetical protein [Herpetosiphon giganteus]|uniref:hypothetical protein n=1 Tax=Herpetosiphon giganteus TaxID=2029754 RepID=UPI00195976FD|nr:hypothetical protein [Herpetosiphon giganteus]MBM7843550.1 hypothetical protein [Herpetosiphon giganteus]